MNEAGVAVFANFLYSDGWRVGVPRYLFTRIALAERSREAAVAAVERTPRASSRNLMVADSNGATDLETATDATARVEPEDGIVAHSNHHVAPALQSRERTSESDLQNSRVRLHRMHTLLRDAQGTLDVPRIAGILRDREGAPDALCRLPGEAEDELITIASTIADVGARKLWIAIGPPNQAAYHAYAV
jgi:hypothetical protein